ncbi:M48 family metalloprotease [Candidatus Woesearchaeota archaeon]|nr:M48 family metalloprotease [Candidatus Woesearchaeota archaeon]
MKNQIKTILLFGLLTGLFLAIGNLLAGVQGLTIALILALAFNFGAYWFSDKIVLSMYRAKETNDLKLINMVKQVSQKAGLPMPKVYMIDSDNPNAFATGRNPKISAIAFTTGIVDLLNEKELKGVIAHELSHIKNRDTLIATIAASIAAGISYIAMIARWSAIFGGFSSSDKKRGSGFEVLFLTVLTPVIATLIRLAISRSREYFADEKAAETIDDPVALADALIKLDNHSKKNPMMFGNRATASLFIVNPFSGKSFLELLSTHPNVEKRVGKLKKIGMKND